MGRAATTAGPGLRAGGHAPQACPRGHRRRGTRRPLLRPAPSVVPCAPAPEPAPGLRRSAGGRRCCRRDWDGAQTRPGTLGAPRGGRAHGQEKAGALTRASAWRQAHLRGVCRKQPARPHPHSRPCFHVGQSAPFMLKPPGAGPSRPLHLEESCNKWAEAQGHEGGGSRNGRESAAGGGQPRRRLGGSAGLCSGCSKVPPLGCREALRTSQRHREWLNWCLARSLGCNDSARRQGEGEEEGTDWHRGHAGALSFPPEKQEKPPATRPTRITWPSAATSAAAPSQGKGAPGEEGGLWEADRGWSPGARLRLEIADFA